jgi:hypothetical protein
MTLLHMVFFILSFSLHLHFIKLSKIIHLRSLSLHFPTGLHTGL